MREYRHDCSGAVQYDSSNRWGIYIEGNHRDKYGLVSPHGSPSQNISQSLTRDEI